MVGETGAAPPGARAHGKCRSCRLTVGCEFRLVHGRFKNMNMYEYMNIGNLLVLSELLPVC